MAAKEYGPVRAAMAIVGAVIYLLASLSALPLVLTLISGMRTGDRGTALAGGLGLGGVLVVVLGWSAMTRLLGVVIDGVEELGRLHRTTRAASDRQAQMLADLIERVDGVAHWTAMSEPTRSLLVRQREIDVFRKQIETAIGEGDWPVANQLIGTYEQHFADKATADAFRTRLWSAREAADDREVRQRISDIRRLTDEANFPAAELALTRLSSDHPDDKRLDDLRSTLAKAQRRHREGLEERFRQLLADKRFEEAAPLLEEMPWLEPDTLAGYREQWKECVRQAQHEARQLFSTAVKDRQWARAAEHGELILARFPDTVLANEVRTVIETLRQRAKSDSMAGAEPPPAAQG